MDPVNWLFLFWLPVVAVQVRLPIGRWAQWMTFNGAEDGEVFDVTRTNVG